MQGLLRVATMPEVDIVLAAIAGSAGLQPTFAALQAGKDVALANKESLVMAGELMIAQARTKRMPNHPGGQRTQRRVSTAQ